MADRNLELALRITAKDTGAAQAVQGIQKDVDGLTTKLRQLAAVAATAFGSREVIRAADEYATLTARIRTATETQEEYNLAKVELFAISQRTRADLSATVDLFQKTNSSLREIGASEQERLQFIEAINQGLAISGAKGPQAAAAILQLSQGLGSGALRGEEFNSVFEASRGLMQAFADGLGVPIGKMRELAEQGELTTERLFAALLSQKDKLAQEYAVFPETIEGALQRVQNAFTRYIGERNADAGGSRALAEALTGLAENFDAVGDAAFVAGGIIAAAYTGKAVAALVAYGRSLATTVAQQVAATQASRAMAAQQLISAEAVLVNAQRQAALLSGIQRLAFAQATLIPAMRQYEVAQTAVAAAGGRAAMASRGLAAAVGFLGGPIGVVTTLLTAGALAWLVWGDRAESAAQKAKRATEEVADQADAILERLKKTDTFGSGDLGILRERASLLEKEISLLARSSGQSPEAAAKLMEKRQALVDILDATAKLAAKEKEQAEQFSRLASGQARDSKALRAAVSEDIKDRIKGYKALEEKIAEVMENSLAAEKRYLANAAALRSKIAREDRPAAEDISQRDQIERDALTKLDLLAQQGKLERLMADGAEVGDLEQQAQLIRDMAEGLYDQAKAKEFIRRVDETMIGANEQAAAAEKQTQQGLRKELDKTQATARDLRDVLEEMEVGYAVTVETKEAKAVLDDVIAKLAQIKDKTITIKVVRDDGQPLDNLSAGVKGFATGGLLQGPGHATSDNILLLGSPGEYMLKAAAVRHYGLPIIDALNNLRLPRFANGGLLSRAQPLPALPRLSATSARAEPLGTVNVNFDFGSLGRFPMQATPDVAKDVASVFRHAALSVGSGR